MGSDEGLANDNNNSDSDRASSDGGISPRWSVGALSCQAMVLT